MPKYKITAESIGYLEDIIEAENEDEAWEKFDEMLNGGEMTEVHGSTENQQLQEIK